MSPSRSRVLVVEDRPSVATLMSEILSVAHEVTTVGDANQALAVISTDPPDVVLTDVRLPVGGGFDVLRAVHERGTGPVVVMMTGYPRLSDAVAAIKLGAFDYLAKPVDASEIALTIARALAHARGERPRTEGPPEVGAVREPLMNSYRDFIEEARARASRAYLTELLQACHGNVTRAARRAGLTRESLHRILKRYCVQSTAFKAGGVDGTG